MNNRIFEIYISDDVSEKLFERLSTALEFSLDIKPQSIAKDFRERYKVKVGNTSPNIGLQEQTHTQNIADSRNGIEDKCH